MKFNIVYALKEKGKEKAKPKVEEEEEEGGFMDMFG